jgi:N-acetyl-anhydromuramyl-L-alanine amidase AmpD
MGIFSKKTRGENKSALLCWIFLFFVSIIFLFGVGYLIYFFFPKALSVFRNNEEPISIATLEKAALPVENQPEKKPEEKAPEKISSAEKKDQPAKAESAVSLSDIQQKLISWGFEYPAAKRDIDTVIVHSSYCLTGKDKYSMDCILKEYKDYTVSAHYLIGRDGAIYQLVDEKNIAYHAGVGQTPDKRNHINNFSIGIELMNTKIDKFTAEQYASLNKLLSEIKSRYTIKYVLGHDQVSPSRKTDPWNFDWTKITK